MVPSRGPSSPIKLIPTSPPAPSLFCTMMPGAPSIDVLDEVLGDQPPLDVGRPAGREVDDEVEALAFVERVLSLAARRNAGEHDGKRRDGDAHARRSHGDPPAGDRLKLTRASCARPAGLTMPGGHGTNGRSSSERKRPCWKKANRSTSTPTILRTRICASSSNAPRRQARSCASRAPTGSLKWERWARS